MAKIVFSALLICLALLSCGQKNLQLLFIQDQDIQGQEVFVQENNLSTYMIFYQNSFVTDNKLDTAKLREQIEAKIPSKDAVGFAILDWEGDAVRTFQSQEDKEKLVFYVNEFIRAVRYAKACRPNIKWGFFHFLAMQYPGTISKFRRKNSNLEPIIHEADFIAPSLYIYGAQEGGTFNYQRNKLTQSLELGAKCNKPVYPFIWHRTPLKDRGGNKLASIDDFKKVVDLISNAEYKGKKADGVLWWHSESYSYRNRNRLGIVKQEYSDVKDVSAYQREIFKTYYKAIESYIRRTDKTESNKR